MMYIKKVVLLGFMFFATVTASQSQVLFGAATGQDTGDQPSSLYLIDRLLVIAPLSDQSVLTELWGLNSCPMVN